MNILAKGSLAGLLLGLQATNVSPMAEQYTSIYIPLQRPAPYNRLVNHVFEKNLQKEWRSIKVDANTDYSCIYGFSFHVEKLPLQEYKISDLREALGVRVNELEKSLGPC
mgnify:CR=1 FL=1